MVPIYSLIPGRIRGALHRYVEHHIPTGDFLRAVLENDLKNAFALADDDCLAALFHIVAFCYNEIPGPCWGSKEAFREWVGARDLDAGGECVTCGRRGQGDS